MDKMTIFGQKPWVYPFEKIQFDYITYGYFYSLEMIVFYVEHIERLFYGLF